MKVIVIDNQLREGEYIEGILKKTCPDYEYAGQALAVPFGIELAKKTDANFVFYGVKTVNQSSIATIKKLRAECPEMHTTLRANYINYFHIKEVMNAGADDYILKPSRPQDIVASLGRCKKSWSAQDSENDDKINELRKKIINAIKTGNHTFAEKLTKDYFMLINNRIGINYEHKKVLCIKLVADVMCIMPPNKSFNIGLSFFCQDFVINLNDKGMEKALCKFVMDNTGLFDANSSHVKGTLAFEAKKYIDDHLSENITLYSIAQKLYVSPAYLSSLFKEMIGESFSNYLLLRRIEKAKYYLSTKDLTIGEISHLTGYDEANSFTRMFKNKIGLSPSAYRESVAANYNNENSIY